MLTSRLQNRRRWLRTIAISGSAFLTPGLFAEVLTETAAMAEGPYYPDKMPLDTDNDLLIVNNSITPAVGEPASLSGRILTAAGQPVRAAILEIWQCDSKQSYLHTKGRGAQMDANFQGYGRFETDSTGRYTFRTIKPISYKLGNTVRCPHIHMAVSRGGKRILTTELHIEGHPDNTQDGQLKRITDPKARASVMTAFRPVAGSKLAEYTASFDVILGRTVEVG
ncbi:MAG TPA: hypothetical protein VEQ63_03240 [Bryobacteraceae bacterium]|nr:hypothetical protein [Bryobacteraceae bacterium]